MATIRRANSSDAELLAELAEQTFRDTFAQHNTPEDLQMYCDAAYGARIQQEEISDPDYDTLVVEEADRLIAYAQLRWAGSPDCVTASEAAEIQRFYVDRAWHGNGLSHDLMAASLAAIAERKSDIVWLGVWERNPRAIAFYRKYNFREVGAHVFTVGSDAQRDVIMVREMT